MWEILFDWYDLKVYIKWNSSLSGGIQVLKDTRQGGVSSAFLLNLFYRQLISILVISGNSHGHAETHMLSNV